MFSNANGMANRRELQSSQVCGNCKKRANWCDQRSKKLGRSLWGASSAVREHIIISFILLRRKISIVSYILTGYICWSHVVQCISSTKCTYGANWKLQKQVDSDGKLLPISATDYIKNYAETNPSEMRWELLSLSITINIKIGNIEIMSHNNLV